MKKLRPYLLLLAVAAADLAVLAAAPDMGRAVLLSTAGHFYQMLLIIPPIFILMGLLDVWVPRETFMRHLGERSGLKGMALSVLIGAAAAGPLYVAFPVAGMMIRKGARFLNILVFLGAWSTMKIPMFLFEMSSLGIRFAALRWLFSLAGILGMGLLIDRLLSREEKTAVYAKQQTRAS